MDIHTRLTELELTLPPAPKPLAVYVPAMCSGEWVVISGQLPMLNGQLVATGPVPSVASVADAQRAAQQCLLNGLSILDQQLGGDWARLVRFVRLGVFVYSDTDFCEQHIVANGASLLLEDIFAQQGQHARAAVGAAALPLGASVEIEIMAQIREPS